jgi:hypothetical protein
MTKHQERSIQKIKDEAPDRYEWKVFEKKEVHGGVVMVTAVYGMPDDEGTLAQTFCRKTGIFLIGTRGGMRAMLSKHLRPIKYAFEGFSNR